MESLDQDFQSTSSGLEVGQPMLYDWKITAKWANFLAIVGFVFIGIGLLGIFSISTVISTMQAFGGNNPMLEMMGAMGGSLTIVMLIALGLQFMITLFQFRFAKNLKQAVLDADQQAFEEAWLQFRNLFRWYGILIILGIIFYIIMAFFMVSYMRANM